MTCTYLHSFCDFYKQIGVSPAPEVKTQLTYQCPKDMRLSHAPNANPTVKIHCLEDGTFTKPETWPMCISIQSKQAMGGI